MEALPAEIKSASLLHGGKVEFSQGDGKLILTIPPAALEPMDTIVELNLDRPEWEIPLLARQRHQGHRLERVSESGRGLRTAIRI